jgi:hypothetical protein
MSYLLVYYLWSGLLLQANLPGDFGRLNAGHKRLSALPLNSTKIHAVEYTTKLRKARKKCKQKMLSGL